MISNDKTTSKTYVRDEEVIKILAEKEKELNDYLKRREQEGWK